MTEPAATPKTSATDLADTLGISERTVRHLRRKGVLDPASGPAEAARAYAAYRATLTPQSATKAAGERLKAAQADLAELKLAEARRELVPAAAVEARWANILQQVKAEVLGIVARVQADLPHLTPFDVQTMDKHVRRSLQTLGGCDGST
jgi:phage terminase Nu1 subunit (DNA packaging protein)